MAMSGITAPNQERRRRRKCCLPRIGEIVRVNPQFDVNMGGKSVFRRQFLGNDPCGCSCQTFRFIQ